MKRFFKLHAIIDDATMSTLGMYVSTHVCMYLGVCVAVELSVCVKAEQSQVPCRSRRTSREALGRFEMEAASGST